MSSLKTLILLVFSVKVVLNNRLISCEEKKCSCFLQHNIYGIYCSEDTGHTVGIMYKKYKIIKMTCYSNDSFLDQLNFDFGEVEEVSINKCKLSRGLHIFDRWNITVVNRLVLRENFDLAIDGIIPNDYFDRIPKGSFEELTIQGCEVKDVEEETFKGFNNLKSLNFAYNKLTKFPSAFKHIPLLTKLYLNNNNIRDLPNGITAPKLKFLYLNWNNITSLGKVLFENIPNLELLELSENPVRNLPQDVLNPLKNLQSVDFGLQGEINITDLFMETKNLKTARFTGGNITSISPNAFKNLLNLESLSIQFSHLKSLPKDLFKNNVNVKYIWLNGNDLTKLPEGIFKNLGELTTLDLSENKLIEWKNEYFGKGLKKLEQLKLDNNELVRIPTLAFGYLPELKILSLNNNGIQEMYRNAFDEYSSITELNLNANNLSNIKVFSYWNLETLNLDNNSYEAIPSIKQLPGLQTLSMRNNKINFLKMVDFDFYYVKILNKLISIINVDLTGNRIETIDFRYYDTSWNEAVLKLILNNNPLSCNCHVYDLLEWIHRNDRKLELIVDNLNCANPPELFSRPVRNVTSEDLKCKLRKMDFMERFECPSDCDCLVYPGRRMLLIDCSERGLKTQPEISAFNYPVKLKPHSYTNIFLNLSGNKIEQFTKVLNYTNITGLDLSRNNLDVIERIPPYITTLNLHANNLSRIDDTLLSTLQNNTLLHSLTLHGNPWNCDCSLVKLTNATRGNFKYLLPKSEQVQCKDGRQLIDLTETELCKDDQTVIIALCAVLAVFLILFATTLAFYYKYETTVKIWLFSHDIHLPFVTEEDIDKNKEFDAFVSYSSNDADFIKDHLLPELEGGSNPYKLCFHERDWTPGEFINKQIIDSVNNSRRTIIVLSKSFLDSTWAPVEFRMAYTNAMNEKRNRLIIIIYDEVKTEDVKDEELQMYLKTNTYVKWGDPWFWKKLRYAMPRHKNKNNKKIEKAKQRIKTYSNSSSNFPESSTAESQFIRI